MSSVADKTNPETAKRKFWTTREELRGDSRVAEIRSSEFFSKPKDYFDREDATRHSLTGTPGLLSETAGFVELQVKNHGGAEAGVSRRDFLKLSGAAMVFATAGCGMRPAEKIIPYVNAPPEITPGVASYYASTSCAAAAGNGVLVKTREGRPIKLEGNPDHPLNQGKLSARDQLDIYNLYDPDRLTEPVKLDRERREPTRITWDNADSEIAEALKAAQGQIVLLTGTIHGPARTRVIRSFLAAFPGARHVMYDAWNHEVTRNAQHQCYGTRVLPRYHFDRAELVVCFETDPLGCGYSAAEWQVDFGKQRKVRDGKLSRLLVFESGMSQTGANADERFRIDPQTSVKIALSIARELAASGRTEIGATNEIQIALRLYRASNVEHELGLTDGFILRIADLLWEQRGSSIVMAGESPELQIAVNLLNSMLGNDGRTIDGSAAPSNQSQGSLSGMLRLVEDMVAGKVKVLISWGTNPAYVLPEAVQFESALENVGTVVSLSDRADETAILGDYILPNVHWLESWGDGEPQRGLYGLTQPAIQPLHDCRAAEQSLMRFARAAGAGILGSFEGGWREFLMDTWKRNVYGLDRYDATFDYFWTSALRAGVIDRRSDTIGEARQFNLSSLDRIDCPKIDPRTLKLVATPSSILTEDGYANNAWALEMPDPVSRISWTNYAGMSPRTATVRGLKEGDVIRLSVDQVSIELPVHVQPGDQHNVVTVQTGWGRKRVGRVGSHVGANAWALLAVTRTGHRTTGLTCTIEKTSRWEEMPCVQGHNYLEGRPIVQDATFDEYLKDPHAGAHHGHEIVSLWPKHDYPGNRWGMSIDLTSCIGCNACIAACQVENNIPVVGKGEIQLGREMHWIRVDRYFSGEEDEPEVVFQPMLCQHCENAPCETVCPVLATVHSDEGLNLQVYNRCVGTRYCANNCPYKVRRFNFYEYSFAAYEPHPLQLALNPDVTVREKGVMEKCSFCQHRIRLGKEKAKEMGREVLDSDVQTACQQTCPTNAITFGNFNHEESRVAQDMKDPRAFHVLEELNVQPSIAYWTKLRNRPPKPSDRAGHGHLEEHHS